jgi:hypothetical protein
MSWLRGEARLTVRNDDPESSIRLAGRDEQIQGVGVEEWTLPAGDYLLLRRRPGRRTEQESIHLARGSRRTFHFAGRDAADERPFVLLRRRGGEIHCASLREAIGESGAGDTIEVRGNGPFVTAPVSIARPLMIRAGDGFQPVFRHDGKDLGQPLISAHQALVLEGLLLEGRGFPHWRDGTFRLVHARGLLDVAACRLQVRRDGICISNDGPQTNLRRSLLLRHEQSGHAAVSWSAPPGSALMLDHCVAAGGHQGVGVNLAPGRPRALWLQHSTLLVGHPFCLFPKRSPDSKQLPAARVLDLQADACLFAATLAVVQLEWTGGEQPTARESEDLLRRAVGFTDRGSFYPDGLSSLLGFSLGWKKLPGGRDFRMLESLFGFWGQRPSAETLLGRIAFQGTNIPARLGKDVTGVAAADFRLEPSSPGRGSARDGSDYGADVDLLGPGPPLERWRRTDEHGRWREQWERRMKLYSEGK